MKNFPGMRAVEFGESNREVNIQSTAAQQGV
jgi:hypothetical protein